MPPRLRIVIIAPGSRGDIQPYVALGVGLKAAGHHIRIVTNEDFVDLVSAHGIEAVSIPINVQAAIQEQQTAASIEGGSLIKSFRKLAEIARQSARLLAEKGLEASEGMDLVLAGVGGLFIASAIAEKRGLKFMQAYNVPLTPTASFAGALLPGLTLLPKLSHHITRQILWLTARAAGNDARKQVLGLRGAPFFGPFDKLLARAPLLYGLSPAVVGYPPEWGARVHVTGFWFLDEDAWAPPADLVAFLDQGPPPVYIGFGSMSSEKPELTTKLVLDAIAKSGRRAIIHAGWSGMRTTELPESVHVVGSVPHSWLFQRVATVVHHGGAGTTAAGLRAGVPSIVVPFHGDQAFWARRVAALGVGPAPIPRTELTSERLALALAATKDAQLQKRASELGAKIRAENGVARAVNHRSIGLGGSCDEGISTQTATRPADLHPTSESNYDHEMLRRLLLLTAVVNIFGAVASLAFPELGMRLLFGGGALLDEAARSTYQILWLFVGLFGVGYYRAARDEKYLEPVLFLGGVGKLMAASVWLSVFVRGTHSVFLAQGLLFDGALGSYFLWALWRSKSRQ